VCSGIGSAACILTCGIGIIAFAITVIRARFTFDEFLHLHFLWLISTGHIPHLDFWCNYPCTGYAILLPFFHVLPESVYSVLVMRILNLIMVSGVCVIFILHTRRLQVHWIWGVLPIFLCFPNGLSPWIVEFRTDALAMLLAISALALLLRNPHPLSGAFAAGLAVLSLLIMPKYVYPLVPAIFAYALYGGFTIKLRRAFIGWLIFGGISGIIVAGILLLTIQVTLWDDFKWSGLFMLRYFAHVAKTETRLPHLISSVVHYFSANWWNALLFIAGIAGLIAVEWKKRGAPLFVGPAIALGIILSWATGVMPQNQYLVPGLFCFTLLVPYVPRLINRPFWPILSGFLLVCLGAFTVIGELKSGAAELGNGELPVILQGCDNLLHIIPPHERVVGLWLTHPCFREDQTFMTWDECWGDPKGFLPLLPLNSPARCSFEPGSIAASMEKSPPAAIAFNSSGNYPAGWNEAIANFLQHHADSYKQVSVLDNAIFIRNDLIK